MNCADPNREPGVCELQSSGYSAKLEALGQKKTMNDLLELNRRAATFGWALLEAQAQAWMVIGMRMPGLAASAASLPGGSQGENRTMVSEKLRAAQQGMLAGSQAAGALGAAAGLGPVAFATAMLGVMEASAGPAHRRVRANALRLSRPSKKRR
jgi:hypothetical protein